MSMSYRRFPGIRWIPISVVLLVLLTGNGFALSPPGSAPHSPGTATSGATELRAVGPATSPPVNVTLTIGNRAANISSQFFGTTVNNEVRMFRGEATAVNATPARVLVWPGAMAGEDYDPLTQTHYDTYSGIPKHALTNESQFVQLCKATHCTAIVQVPAEIDNASFAEAVVNYTEVNLSFTPAYWMIGNEPELWSHWKLPWKDWATQSSGGPDPTQFGHEVVAYVKAIRAVDSTTPILGLPASGCTCGSWTFPQWISGVLNVTGSKIQSVAFHEYPAGWLGTGDGSLEDFYWTIQSAAGIPPRLVAARAAVTSSCPGCNVSVFISELG
ncbi:MAG: glycoside hydrolase family 44 protein, partial [Thermoplasmata archaeon]|nr:glycoside hydrolase family 44 protein [Thermoplasmata archaeon]